MDVSIVARGTPGFSGADLANVVNIAAIKASQVLILADKKAIEASNIWSCQKLTNLSPFGIVGPRQRCQHRCQQGLSGLLLSLYYSRASS